VDGTTGRKSLKSQEGQVSAGMNTVLNRIDQTLDYKWEKTRSIPFVSLEKLEKRTAMEGEKLKVAQPGEQKGQRAGSLKKRERGGSATRDKNL